MRGERRWRQVALGDPRRLVPEKGVKDVRTSLRAQRQRELVQSAKVGKLLGKAERAGGDAGLDSAQMLAGAPKIRLGRLTA